MTAPEDDLPLPPLARFLKRLVLGLAIVMGVGVAAIAAALVWRLTDRAPPVPSEIALPDGVQARAVTWGDGWVAIVTADDRILIFDQVTGALRQEIALSP